MRSKTGQYRRLHQEAGHIHKKDHIDQVQRRDGDKVEQAIFDEDIDQSRGGPVRLVAQPSPERQGGQSEVDSPSSEKLDCQEE